MAGMPMVLARIAVWLDPDPPSVTNARILFLSSWMVSLGARSSAASITGTSESMPPCTTPNRILSMRPETSLTSAALACMYESSIDANISANCAAVSVTAASALFASSMISAWIASS